MKNTKFLSEKLFGVVLADVMLSLAAYIFIMFTLISLLPHKEGDPSEMSGRLCVSIYWDNNRDVDLDLWGLGPHQTNAVGFTNTHESNMDLLRDVIGFSNNPEHINMEMLCAHSIIPGEYTFDVNYYSDHEASNKPDPNHDSGIDVKMIIRIKAKDNKEYTKITTWHLSHEQEDKTMFDFIVDENGMIKENSINSTDKYIAHHNDTRVSNPATVPPTGVYH